MSIESFNPKFGVPCGSGPRVELVLQSDYPFAHEAGVLIPIADELYIISNQLFNIPGEQRVRISRPRIGKPHSTISCEELICSGLAMANRSISYREGIIFCAQGNQSSPSGLYYVPLADQDKLQLPITDFYGRPFNSVNDVVVHEDGSIWFTDPTNGYEQGHRPPPRLPSQVYRFQPSDGSIRAMADGFGHPNGICFSPAQNVVYVTDTDWIWGDGTTDDTRVSSIYAFDLVGPPDKYFLTNRRLFAMCDTGIPDGIKCDSEGNVYTGCGDGLNIWDDGGTLLSKIPVEGDVANFCFGHPGQIFLFNETKLWRASLNDGVTGASVEN